MAPGADAHRRLAGPRVSARDQLSLFVPLPASDVLESVRRALDPVQHALIPAHVTLCRDDEIAGVHPELLRRRLQSLPSGPLAMVFGSPERFEGHGVQLKCLDGERSFQALRQHVLANELARRLPPHITLAHPRNPAPSDEDLLAVGRLATALRIEFRVVRWIRQESCGPWQVLDAFPLVGRA